MSNSAHLRCGWIGSETRVAGGGPGARSFAANASFFKVIHPLMYVPGPNGEVFPARLDYLDPDGHVTVDPVIAEAAGSGDQPLVSIWPTIFSTSGDQGGDVAGSDTMRSATLDELRVILRDPTAHINSLVNELRRLRATSPQAGNIAGIDIDYEHLGGGDQGIYTTFITRLCDAMHAAGVDLKVSAAVTATGPAYLNPSHGGAGNTAYEYIDLINNAGIDAIHVMAYDKHGSGLGQGMPCGPHQGPNTPVWFLRAAMTAAIRTARPECFVFGLPNYGRDFGAVDADGDALIFPLTGIGDRLAGSAPVTTDDPHDSDNCPPGDLTRKCCYREDDGIDPNDARAISGLQPNATSAGNPDALVYFETLDSLDQKASEVAGFTKDDGSTAGFGVAYFPVGDEPRDGDDNLFERLLKYFQST